MLFTSTGDGPERQRCLAGNGTSVLGDRLANLRNEAGITQQELAERIAISRVALSNLESGRSVPGERTVALLAGVFGMEPHELVDGTHYPVAKIDRLPLTTNRYTEAQMRLALMERDLLWLGKVDNRSVDDRSVDDRPADDVRADSVIAEWTRELAVLRTRTHDPRDRQLVTEALRRLGQFKPGQTDGPDRPDDQA